MHAHNHVREPSFKSLTMEKHLRLYIKTKSFNKIASTLLTCASSFSSSKHTLYVYYYGFYNVGVNTSCVLTQNTFQAYIFFLLCSRKQKFLPCIRNFHHILSSFFSFFFSCPSSTKVY